MAAVRAPAGAGTSDVRRCDAANPERAIRAALDIGDTDDAECSAIAVAVLAVGIPPVVIAGTGITAIAVEPLLGSPGAHLDCAALAGLLVSVIALRVLAVAGHRADDRADDAAIARSGIGSDLPVRVDLCGSGRRDRGDRRQSSQGGCELRKIGHGGLQIFQSNSEEIS